MKAEAIQKKEGLNEKITAYLLNERSSLIDKGYDEDEAGLAIANCLPFCIFKYALESARGSAFR